MRPGGVLALDLAGTVGWAYGHDGDVLPGFGIWVLAPGPALGPKYVGYENELIAALGRFSPSLVLMEAPLPASAQSSTNVARLLFGLAAYTEGECDRAGVLLREERSGIVRAAVMGRGRFATGTAKAQVVAWCQGQGYGVPDHNAGDACVLWRYGCAIQRRRGVTRRS